MKRSPFICLLLLSFWSYTCGRRDAKPAPSEPPAIPPRETGGLTDLKTLASELPRLHPNLFFDFPEALWRTWVKDVEQALPTMSRARMATAFATLLAGLRDGHTGLALEALPEFGRLPIQLREFPDGLYVIEAGKEHASLRGKRLTRIGRRDDSMARAMVKDLISRDNRHGLATRSAVVLTIPEVLHAVEITDRTDLVPVETADGAVHQLARVASWREVDWAPPAGTMPLARRNPRLAYWNDWLEDSRTVFFQYNRCADDPAAGMTFADLVERTFAFMKQKPVERFVLDLRNNGGGDSRIAAPLIAALAAHPTLNARGRLFVFIGRDTFSSAVLNTLELKEKTQALTVGEPTGGRPNHYGEVKYLTLPHTGWKISYSTKYFTTGLVKGNPDALVPDLPVEVTGAAWFSGRDPVLDAALAFTPGS